jgi:pentatricopeptide repeat protein
VLWARSVITYSSLMSACEKAGQWETALQIFGEMQKDGCVPNTVTYNSLVTACAQGAASDCSCCADHVKLDSDQLDHCGRCARHSWW